MAAELRCPNTFETLFYARSRVAHAAALAELDVSRCALSRLG